MARKMAGEVRLCEGRLCEVWVSCIGAGLRGSWRSKALNRRERKELLQRPPSWVLALLRTSHNHTIVLIIGGAMKKLSVFIVVLLTSIALPAQKQTNTQR